MSNDDSEQNENREIPDAKQDITTEEIVEAEYEVLSPSESHKRSRSGTDDRPARRGPIEFAPPGRTRFDDSIEASSDDPGGDSEGKKFSAGYESHMATRIGDEAAGDGGERLRELHEGRHQSDDEHSTRESQRDKKRITQALCSALPLAPHEEEDTVAVIKQLDLTQFGNQRGISRVVLGAIIVVVDEHHRQSRVEPDEFVMWSEEFRALCDRHDVNMSDLSTIKETVRTALDSGEATIGPENPRRDTDLPEPTSPQDLPMEYWSNIDAQQLVSMAKSWEHAPDDVKEAIPPEYEERIRLLRKWQPWPDEDDQETGARPLIYY